MRPELRPSGRAGRALIAEPSLAPREVLKKYLFRTKYTIITWLFILKIEYFKFIFFIFSGILHLLTVILQPLFCKQIHLLPCTYITMQDCTIEYTNHNDDWVNIYFWVLSLLHIITVSLWGQDKHPLRCRPTGLCTGLKTNLIQMGSISLSLSLCHIFW